MLGTLEPRNAGLQHPKPGLSILIPPRAGWRGANQDPHPQRDVLGKNPPEPGAGELKQKPPRGFMESPTDPARFKSD